MAEREPREQLSKDLSRSDALPLAREVVSKFQLTDLQPLLSAIEAQVKRKELNLAVFGRFKAGKSSFINHLLRREVLPVGVVPVTSVVTQIRAGKEDFAEVRQSFPEKSRCISVEEIASYVTEAQNPGNAKKVSLVQLQLPEMQRFPGIQLVDTPGVESIFEHNAEAARSWFPNVDLALVAVSVDPPLTRQDVFLIEQLFRFTPKISVLLTKVDQLDEKGRKEVLEFVTAQLRARFAAEIRIFPYSIRPGFEPLRESFENDFLWLEIAAREENRTGILQRKVDGVLRSAESYLSLALRSLQQTEAEREELRHSLEELEKCLPDRRLQIRLAVQHGLRSCRGWIEKTISDSACLQVQKKLAHEFEQEFPAWHGSFAKVLAKFESWLEDKLEGELAKLSREGRAAFLEPLYTVQRQVQQQLQSVREMFSEKMLALTGVALAAPQTNAQVVEPASPDISIGKIFDRNWELISLLIPMPLVRGIVRKKFAEKIEGESEKNISRLTSQWEESLATSMKAAQSEGERGLEEYVATIRRMVETRDGKEADELAETLRWIKSARADPANDKLPAGTASAFRPQDLNG
jgi:GTP-binding protein EngB required for normal cell division